MCGIAGYLFGHDSTAASLEEKIKIMLAQIVHRGPDSEGLWVDPDFRGVLGHRRLSILDLSHAGHQPMVSRCGRFVLVFNGEIYNHQSIRDSMGGRDWRGHSDTETVLASIEKWGVRTSLEKFNGMFAFALWDLNKKTITLCRDRFGEKPLYYGWIGSGANSAFVFSSDLKSIEKLPGFERKIDRNALGIYFGLGFVPAPHSIYEGIAKLPAGTYLSLSLDCPSHPTIKSFWNAKDRLTELAQVSNNFSREEVIDGLDSVLQSAVKRQMISDVPVGSFLSGGVDSTIVTAMMQSQSSKPIRTFTIGNVESDYDESVFAKAMSDHLGTAHNELIITSDMALNIIPEMADVYSEPFADSSQIPTFLVAKLAASQVKVVLSGDGADELFGGYNRYVLGQWWLKANKFVPTGLQNRFANFISSIGVERFACLIRHFQSALPVGLRQSRVNEKLEKFISIAGSGCLGDLHLNLMKSSEDSNLIFADNSESLDLYQILGGGNSITSVEDMLLFDTLVYLPDDILAKVDRATMWHSLEGRAPFLDMNVFEYAWGPAKNFRIEGSGGKRILKELLYKYVPKELVERPKMGFSVPIGTWLKGPLRPWVDDLLSKNSVRRSGLLNEETVWEVWTRFKLGDARVQTLVWNLVVFQSWCGYRYV